jgi:hypothetical protein
VRRDPELQRRVRAVLKKRRVGSGVVADSLINIVRAMATAAARPSSLRRQSVLRRKAVGCT